MMKTNTTNRKQKVLSYLLYAAVITASVILDRITKSAATSFFENEGDSVTAIPGVLNFTYVLNEGATAGMLADHRWVFMSFSAVAISAVLLYLVFSKKINLLTGISLSMVAGGGVGNMIDRVSAGAVVDFFDVTAVNFFPFNCIFNVADVFVSVGGVLLVISFIIDEIRENRAKNVKQKTDK